MGDEADLVVAFNEQVLYSRIANGAYRNGTLLLLENKWQESPQPEIRAQYSQAVAEFKSNGLVVYELPIEKACLEHTDSPRKGKNMFVLGMLCHMYSRDMAVARAEIANTFKRKGDKVIADNQRLFDAGCAFAQQYVPTIRYVIPPRSAVESEKQRFIVSNGNQALGLGVMAAGMELVSMYPITPATSASHYLANVFYKVGGFVHQAKMKLLLLALLSEPLMRVRLPVPSPQGLA